MPADGATRPLPFAFGCIVMHYASLVWWQTQERLEASNLPSTLIKALIKMGLNTPDEILQQLSFEI